MDTDIQAAVAEALGITPDKLAKYLIERDEETGEIILRAIKSPPSSNPQSPVPV